jgi:Arc/MetJ family transcription regulator
MAGRQGGWKARKLKTERTSAEFLLSNFKFQAVNGYYYFYLDLNLMCIYCDIDTHYFGRPGMRTNIVIDDAIMKEAMMLSKIKTKKAVVETGLKLLVQIKKQEQIKSLRGKLKWDGDLEKMRLDH